MLKRYFQLPITERLGWIATLVLIVASAVNGLGYYPLGPLMLATGGLLWLLVGVMRRDWPIIVTNAVMSTVGLATIIYTLSR
jgi:uncharacterized protein with PQ loop repeat